MKKKYQPARPELVEGYEQKIKFFKTILFFITLFHNILSIDQYYCTASDEKYYENLLNLIGSIHHTNFENLKEIAVFNLGLNQNQMNYLNSIKKVKVYEIEKNYLTEEKNNKTSLFIKSIILKKSLEIFPYVLFVDSGLAVLNNLNNLFDYIKSNEYFLCSVDVLNVDWQFTKYFREKFNLNNKENKWILNHDSIMNNLIGINKIAYESFAIPLNNFTYELKKCSEIMKINYDQPTFSLFVLLNKYKVFPTSYKKFQPINLLENININLAWNRKQITDQTHIYLLAKYDINFNNKFILHLKFK